MSFVKYFEEKDRGVSRIPNEEQGRSLSITEGFL